MSSIVTIHTTGPDSRTRTSHARRSKDEWRPPLSGSHLNHSLQKLFLLFSLSFPLFVSAHPSSHSFGHVSPLSSHTRFTIFQQYLCLMWDQSSLSPPSPSVTTTHGGLTRYCTLLIPLPSYLLVLCEGEESNNFPSLESRRTNDPTPPRGENRSSVSKWVL